MPRKLTFAEAVAKPVVKPEVEIISQPPCESESTPKSAPSTAKTSAKAVPVMKNDKGISASSCPSNLFVVAFCNGTILISGGYIQMYLKN